MAGWLGSRRGPALAALMVVGAAALAGCAEESSGNTSAGGEGVEPGATMEEFQAAFEDVEEITLVTQTPAPKGSSTGLPMEKYFEAVEEWSGGKIKFDVTYSSGIAGPDEGDDALLDGRLDFASVLPIYEPSEYPANAALIEGGFISDQSAINGSLSSNAWPNQVAFDTDEVMQEFEDHGMVPLLPVYNSGANALFCSDERNSLETIEGAAVGAGGTAQSAQVEALGGSPSTLDFTELFESLQRGVVDCTVSSPTVAVLGGFATAAPHVVIDPEAGFALAPGTLAFSQATWESLPLAAQQLLWDRLDVFLASNLVDKVFPNNAEMVKQVTGAGGEVQPFAEDARVAMQEENARLLENLKGTDAVADGAAFVEAMESANQDWQAKVAELGYEDVPYNEFDTYLAENEFDLSDYSDLVMREIFDAHRPS
jgi:TRAP-type C4-dicarboxylate transport system substrate-binding protein